MQLYQDMLQNNSISSSNNAYKSRMQFYIKTYLLYYNNEKLDELIPILKGITKRIHDTGNVNAPLLKACSITAKYAFLKSELYADNIESVSNNI